MGTCFHPYTFCVLWRFILAIYGLFLVFIGFLLHFVDFFWFVDFCQFSAFLILVLYAFSFSFFFGDFFLCFVDFSSCLNFFLVFWFLSSCIRGYFLLFVGIFCVLCIHSCILWIFLNIESEYLVLWIFLLWCLDFLLFSWIYFSSGNLSCIFGFFGFCGFHTDVNRNLPTASSRAAVVGLDISHQVL